MNNANNGYSFRLVHQSHYPNLSTGNGIDVSSGNPDTG